MVVENVTLVLYMDTELNDEHFILRRLAICIYEKKKSMFNSFSSSNA